MRVFLYNKRFVSPLVERAGADRLCSGLYLAGVRTGEMMHEYGEITIFLRIQQKMPVVWHDGVRKQAHAVFLACFLDEIFKELEFGIGIEYLQSHDGTVDDVIGIRGKIDASVTGHDYMLPSRSGTMVPVPDLKALAVAVVVVALGLPPKLSRDAMASSGEDWSMPENEAPASLIASVAPVMVTDSVLEPNCGLARYQISEAMPPLRVLVALVRAVPL